MILHFLQAWPNTLSTKVTGRTKKRQGMQFIASLPKSIDTNRGFYKLEKNYSLYALHKRSKDALYF